MPYHEDRHYHRTRDRYQDPYYTDPRSDIRRRNESMEDLHRYPPSDHDHDHDYDYGHGYEYGYGYPRRSRVAMVQEGMRRSHSLGGRGPYEDSEYSYRPRHERRSRHERDRRERYSRSPSSSRSSPRRRHKSFSEQALGALGLGPSASSPSRHRERDHGRGRSHGHHARSYSYSPSRSRSRSRSRDRDRGRHRDKSDQRMAQAVRAALTAGAVEAFRVRKEPGEWTGEKGKRVLTAAITAAGTDGLVDRDPDKHSKRHIIESTLAGLAANHLVNGPRSHSRSRSKSKSKSESRSSSSSRSKLKTLAATGALAAVGKEAYEHYKSRPRSRRGRSRSRSSSSSRDSDDEDGSRRRRKRSKSLTDYISQGIEALGLGDKRKDDRDRHRGRSSRYDEYSDRDRISDRGSRRSD